MSLPRCTRCGRPLSLFRHDVCPVPVPEAEPRPLPPRTRGDARTATTVDDLPPPLVPRLPKVVAEALSAAILREATADLLRTRAPMMRVGLALAMLAPDDEELVAALEAEGAAAKRLTDLLERLTDQMCGPGSPPAPPPARGDGS